TAVKRVAKSAGPVDGRPTDHGNAYGADERPIVGVSGGVKIVCAIRGAIPDGSPDLETDDLFSNHVGLAALRPDQLRVRRIGSVDSVGDGRKFQNPVSGAELFPQLVAVSTI